MRRGPVVVAAVLCAVVGVPQTASAAGSYGAVVEKGVRGCTTDPESGVVICFESPTVDSQSGGLFLQAWRAADVRLTRWDSGVATLVVRALSVRAERRSPLTYLARADLVTSQLVCREEFRFTASVGDVRLESIAGDCEALGRGDSGVGIPAGAGSR